MKFLLGDSKGALLCSEGLAQLELFWGNVDKAREVYASGERCHSPNSRYYRMWANLEKRQGSCQTARKLYQKAHNTNPQVKNLTIVMILNLCLGFANVVAMGYP